MKTKSYNPSTIELEFANAVKELQVEIQKKLTSNRITEVQNNSNADNPTLVFKLEDKDGDRHELVLQFIQRLDE
jgi:hypothetical protein